MELIILMCFRKAALEMDARILSSTVGHINNREYLQNPPKLYDFNYLYLHDYSSYVFKIG